MADLNWRRYTQQFTDLADAIMAGDIPAGQDIGGDIHHICSSDPAVGLIRLGVESFRIAFLEFLFAQAEGPYSPSFLHYAGLISFYLKSSEPLKHLIDHNAADAIGNMVLNKRGRLKFLIADHLELMILLDWWPRFGLEPVSERQVLDAVLKKPLLHHRLETGDPGLMLRLLEVFPDFQSVYCPQPVSREALMIRLASVTPLPSCRRYHHLYATYLREGRDIREIIRQEDERILPVHLGRNTFLAFLVKKMYLDTCQICQFGGRKISDPDITVHHIIPLSEGGADKAWNMLVVCRSHHQAIHEGAIFVRIREQISVRCKKGSFTITPQFQKPG